MNYNDYVSAGLPVSKTRIVFSKIKAVLLFAALISIFLITNSNIIEISDSIVAGCVLIFIIFVIFEFIGTIWQIIVNKKDIRNRFISILEDIPEHRLIDSTRRICILCFIALIVLIIKIENLGNYMLNTIELDMASKVFLMIIRFSMPAYILIVLLTIIHIAFFMPHEGDAAYGPWTLTVKTIKSDVFRLYYVLFTSKNYKEFIIDLSVIVIFVLATMHIIINI